MTFPSTCARISTSGSCPTSAMSWRSRSSAEPPRGEPFVQSERSRYPHVHSPRPEGRAMPGRRKKAKAVPFNAADVANIAKANPYIQRLIEDSKLRDNVRSAIDSTKSAYTRLTNGKAPAKALLEDKKLQGDLREALEAVR